MMYNNQFQGNQFGMGMGMGYNPQYQTPVMTNALTQEEINKLSIEHSCDFQSKLMIETYTCPSCGDMKDFIHILY